MLEIQKKETGLVSSKLVIPKEDVPKIKKEEYKKIKNNVVRNGFRKGKVPLELAENMFGLDSLYNRRLSNIMMKGLLEKNLIPYQYTKFDIEKDLTVDADFYPLQTDIKFTCDINTLAVEEEPIKEPEVTDEELKAAKDILRKQNSTAREHDKGYAAKINDDIVVDFKVSVEGSDEITEKKDHAITLGFGLLEEKIEKGLIGINPEETRNIEVEIKGVKYSYIFICKKVIEVDLITIKELLDTMDIETEAALDEKLSKELLDNKKKRMLPFVDNRRIAIDKLVENLKKNSNFKLEEKMLEDITKNVKSEHEKSFMVNIHKNNFAMRSLLLAASDELKLEVTDEELENEFKNMKKKDTDEVDKITAGINILINKVVDKLVKKIEKEEENGKDIQS